MKGGECLMPRELLNANITHVSYVDKGANKKTILSYKVRRKTYVSKGSKGIH